MGLILHYNSGLNSYTVAASWTEPDGHSRVFSHILHTVARRHRFNAAAYARLASELDLIADKLYQVIYIINNEHSFAPYNPKLRKRLIGCMEELYSRLDLAAAGAGDDWYKLLLTLFRGVADKLQEIADVFLVELKYQGKHRWRKTNKEQSVEVTDEKDIACEFEEMLLTMTDLSRMLDCLTEKQRERLVKHVILRYTFQEIADSEGTDKKVIYRSVAAALKKLRDISQ